MNDSENLQINYSAPTESERREIERIKLQYINKEEDLDSASSKVEKLKNLHKKVTVFPTIFSISLGIVGTLLFGLGMTMTLEWSQFLWGSVVAAVGLLPIALSYPLYSYFYNKNKQKYGNKIIELSDEILGE